MSMTREEAIMLLKSRRNIIGSVDVDWCANETEALDLALSALRPVTREQVENVCRGEWKHEKIGKFNHLDQYTCSKCGFELPWNPSYLPIWCEKCGAPMTDEAVDILLGRLEALKDDSTTD